MVRGYGPRLKGFRLEGLGFRGSGSGSRVIMEISAFVYVVYSLSLNQVESGLRA